MLIDKANSTTLNLFCCPKTRLLFIQGFIFQTQAVVEAAVVIRYAVSYTVRILAIDIDSNTERNTG